MLPAGGVCRAVKTGLERSSPNTAHVAYVRPDRVRYARRQSGTIEMRIVNPGGRKFSGRVLCEVVKELDETRVFANCSIEVPAAGQKTIEIPYTNDGVEFGREVRATLCDTGGRTLSVEGEYFTVADDRDFFKVYIAAYPYARGQSFGPHKAWPADWSIDLRRRWLEKNPYTYPNLYERFCWSPGGQMDLTPERERYWSGQNAYLVSTNALLERIRVLQRRGVAVMSYVISGATGPAGYEVYRQHPEWFEPPKQFDVEALVKWDTRTREDVVHAWYVVWPKYTVKEVRDHAINELIESKKRFGWDGFRWDCGQFPAPTPELNAAYLREMKQRVREVFPDTLFGYNAKLHAYGVRPDTDPEAYLASPHPSLAELCRGGGMILHEATYAGFMGGHHLHRWDDYLRYLVRAQEIIQRLGGYYTPFVQRKSGAKYDVDKRYESIVQLAARTHPVALFYYHGFLSGFHESLSRCLSTCCECRKSQLPN